jgi:hypothetical protein
MDQAFVREMHEQLRRECEKVRNAPPRQQNGMQTRTDRCTSAIGLSSGPGHRQHAWYARTARLKSVISSNLD